MTDLQEKEQMLAATSLGDEANEASADDENGGKKKKRKHKK